MSIYAARDKRLCKGAEDQLCGAIDSGPCGYEYGYAVLPCNAHGPADLMPVV